MPDDKTPVPGQPTVPIVPPSTSVDIDLPMSAKTAEVLAWAAWIMVLIGTVAGALAALALVPDVWRQASAGLSTIAFLVAAEIRRRLPSAKAMQATILKSVLPLMLAGGALVLSGCPNAYTIAKKTTAGVMFATQTTSRGVAAQAEVEHKDCLAKHGAKTVDYRACIASARKRLVTYRDVARPAARSAVAAAYAGIRIAESAKAKDVDYMAILKPGACALILGLREWGHKLGDKGAAVLSLLDPFSGMVCDKVATPAAAAAIVIALLPVVVDLVKWIVSLVGSGDEDLMKQVNAWIQGPATDEVDAVILKIDAAAPAGVR